MSVGDIVFLLVGFAFMGITVFAAYKAGYHSALAEAFGAIADSFDRVEATEDGVKVHKAIQECMDERGLWKTKKSAHRVQPKEVT